jgi:hypothetical protein
MFKKINEIIDANMDTVTNNSFLFMINSNIKRKIPLKTHGEIRWSGRVSSSCSTSDTRRVNLVTNPSNQNYVFRQNKIR